MELVCKKDYNFGSIKFVKNNSYNCKIIKGYKYNYVYFNNKLNVGIPFVLSNDNIKEYFYTLDELRILKFKKIL